MALIWAFGALFSINLKTSAFHHTTHVKVAAGAPEVNFLALALTGKQARLIGRTCGTNPGDGKLQFKLQCNEKQCSFKGACEIAVLDVLVN